MTNISTSLLSYIPYISISCLGLITIWFPTDLMTKFFPDEFTFLLRCFFEFEISFIVIFLLPITSQHHDAIQLICASRDKWQIHLMISWISSLLALISFFCLPGIYSPRKRDLALSIPIASHSASYICLLWSYLSIKSPG